MIQLSQSTWPTKILIVSLSLGLFFLLGLHLTERINLTVVDIGRHIINGQLILAGHTEILYQNFYSFTHPDYPFINHHWFFGVLAFGMWLLGGFPLLSVAYVGLIVLALGFFLKAASLRGNIELNIFLAYIALPLLWERQEIRPEGISMLFLGVYYYYLTRFSLGQIKFSMLLGTFIVLQIIWVNTHIFFFLGPLLVFTFLWDAHIHGQQVQKRHLRFIVIATLTASVVNPSLWAGMMTPLNVFKGFALPLFENFSIMEILNSPSYKPIYGYYLFVFVLGAALMLIAVLTQSLKKNLAFIVLFIFLLFSAVTAIRLVPPFGLFLIPLGSLFASSFLSKITQEGKHKLNIIFLLGAFFMACFYAVSFEPKKFGIGVHPSANMSAKFYKKLSLQGPIYNNYGIGGFLIYHFAPQEKLFVDNRLEAFPADFIKRQYVRMQEDEHVWQEMNEKYRFNVIYFKRTRLTPRELGFLKRRSADPQWALIFADAFAVIFLKRTQENASIIKRYEFMAKI